MRVRALRKSDILSATIAVGILLTSGAGFLYLGTLRDKSTFQNNETETSVQSAETITQPDPTYETPKVAAPTTDESSVTITSENANCDKTTNEDKSSSDDEISNSTSTTINCQKNDDNSSSSVKIEASTNQTSESIDESNGAGQSISNSSQQTIKINQ